MAFCLEVVEKLREALQKAKVAHCGLFVYVRALRQVYCFLTAVPHEHSGAVQLFGLTKQKMANLRVTVSLGH